MKFHDLIDGRAARKGLILLLSLTFAAGCSEKKGPEQGQEAEPKAEMKVPEERITCAAGDIAIIDMYLSPADKKSTGAVFCTLMNRGSETDSLIAITTPIASAVEIHEIVEDGNMTTSRQIEGGLPIRGQESVELGATGPHIITLVNLMRDLKNGDTVELEFQFARAGKVTCTGIVGNAPPKPSTETAASGGAENAMGAEVYKNYCQTCHQEDGAGIDPVFPPLAGSDYLKKKNETIDAIVNGKQGKITVSGKEYDGVMPPLISLYDNEQAAAVINYVVQKYGDGSWSTTADEVKSIRKE